MVEKLAWHRVFHPASNKRKIVGVWPQGVLLQKNVTANDRTHPGRISKTGQDHPVDKEFEIPYFKADKEAIPTDFITVVGRTFSTMLLVSPRCKAILDQYNMSDHEIFEIEGVFTVGILPYYLYIFYGENIDAIDFGKTIFEYKYFGTGSKPEYKEPNKFHLKDVEELNFLNKKHDWPQTRLFARELVLDSAYNRFDLIRFWKVFYGFFITESLKNELIENKITGWGLQSQPAYTCEGIQKYITL